MDLLEVKEKKNKSDKRHPWEMARFEVVCDIIKKKTTFSGKNTILDIGCGDLYFIERLAEIYPEAQFIAVDTAFDETTIEFYKRKVNIKNIFLYKDLTTALRNNNTTIDLILLLDVLEHIEKDIDFLIDLRTYQPISDKTEMIITVPAFQSLFCSHDTFLGHYRRYTNKLLQDTVTQCGWEKIYVGYFFSTLLPPRVVQVIKEKIFPVKDLSTGLVEWNGGSVLSGTLKNILLMDYKFSSFLKSLKINIGGLSNYIVCKKSVL